MQYREAIDWLFSTQMFGIKLGLDGIHHLLKEFIAYPDHGTQVIHVAGTNGKGSTCAMIESVARACGRRTGLFTSPHLIDYRERIQVSGQQIPETECAKMLTELKDICSRLDTHPTFFEISTALAMRWFHEQGCELIVLETGMGGRLDATTAVPADVCVITPIGLDHMQWLGDTLEKIASEKAGILVEGKPVVCAPQDDAARMVLVKEANQKRSPITFIQERLQGYAIALDGEHQQWNAALALAALHHAKIPLNIDAVRYGLANISWPGRFEKIRPHVILDGAHNPQAAEVLARTWQQRYPDIRPTLIFSAVAAKDIANILQLIAPLASRIVFCPVDTPRAVAPAELAALLPENSVTYELFDSFKAAFAAAESHPEPILITGSLFLVGEARAFFTDAAFQSSSQ